MASYGRQFEFRVPPDAKDRDGQHVTPLTGARIPIGAPIVVDKTKTPNALGLQPVKLATSGAATAPGDGLKGFLVYEETLYQGVDAALTTHSDVATMSTAPLGAAVQMVADKSLVVVFRNTVAQTFLGSRSIPGRVMVAGFGATPSIIVGDYLAPGVGNDTDGYWAEVSALSDAWLVITALNHDRGEVEARMLI